MNSSDLSIKSYTDLNELNKLKQAGRSDSPQALEAVAKQFESLFLNMLLQNMRKANESLGGDSLFSSNQSKFYQEMMDQQLAVSLSEQQGIGLSEVLVRQLSPKGDVQQAAAAAKSRQAFDRALEQSAAAAVQGMLKQADRVESSDLSAQSAVSGTQVSIETPQQFVAALHPIAQEVGAEMGVDPNVLLAQAALETGWGKKLPQYPDGRSSYNLFGIKADQRWPGERVSVDTLEYRGGVAQREKAAFRAYDSFESSMRDYLQFLQSSPRYDAALADASDSESFLNKLQQAGYATDPEYARKISGIMNGEVLLSALAGLNRS